MFNFGVGKMAQKVADLHREYTEMKMRFEETIRELNRNQCAYKEFSERVVDRLESLSDRIVKLEAKFEAVYAESLKEVLQSRIDTPHQDDNIAKQLARMKANDTLASINQNSNSEVRLDEDEKDLG